MNGTIKWLVIILVVQIGLAGYLASRSNPLEAFQANEPLLSFDVDQVDTIVIEDGEGEKLSLVKRDAKDWTIPSFFDFPVSKNKLSETLDKLKGLQKTWPVGTTKLAAKQLKVVDEDFERKVSFKKGEQVLGTMYVGSSPGFKKAHVRLNDEDLTYAVEVSSFDFATTNSTWRNRDLLRMNRDKLVAVRLPNFTLENKEGKFVPTELAENEEVDSGEVDSVIKKVTGMAFTDVFGKEAKEEYNLANPDFTFTLVTEDEEYVYDFGLPKEGEKDASYYVLKTSGAPFYFKVLPTTIKALKKVERGELVTAKAAPEEAAVVLEEEEVVPVTPAAEEPPEEQPAAE